MLTKKFQQILANFTKINLPALSLNIIEGQQEIFLFDIVSIFAFMTPDP